MAVDVDIDKPVKLEERKIVGKGLNGLRRDGKVPAVIHNHGQQSIYVMVPELEMERIYKVAGKHHPLQLVVGEQKFLALIKGVHYNPVKLRIQHVVFQALRRDETVEAEIPIRFEGEIPAEKIGLMVLTQLDHIEVEALPKNLPDEIVVDATKLAELHDKIIVSDLVLPEGVSIITELDHPIATVVETKAQMAEEAEEASEATGEGAESDQPGSVESSEEE